MMKKNFSLAWLVLLLAAPAVGQSILEQYVKQGVASNLQLQQEELNYQRSVTGLALARSYFMPSLGVNATYTLAGGGRLLQFPVGDLLNPVYATLNQITGSDRFPQIANVNEQLAPNHFHETTLRVTQVLFNPEVYFGYKAQKELVSVQQAQKQAYENQLRYNILDAYYQYWKTEEALQVFDRSLVILNEALRVNRTLVATEKVTRDAVLNTEFEISRVTQQRTDMLKNRDVAQGYFNFLLNRPLQENIVKDSLALAVVPEGGGTLADLQAQAVQQRQELKQVQNALRANEQVVALNKNSALLPKILAVGDAGYQGFGYTFDNTQDYWLVQFRLAWDIFKGGEKRARTQQAKIDYQLMENRLAQTRQQIEWQVIQSYRTLEAAEENHRTTQAGVRSAEKSFQIVAARYREGQAIVLEFLDAQNKVTTAHLNQSMARYELLRAQADLQKTLSTL
jgi:outer membrane protein TolC